MPDFLMIVPGDWKKVEDQTVLPYSAEYFEQFEGTGEHVDITEMFINAGLITSDQAIAEVKYVNDTGCVWYLPRNNAG